MTDEPKVPDQDFAGLVDAFAKEAARGKTQGVVNARGFYTMARPEYDAARSALLARYEAMGESEAGFDLVSHLKHQREWSEATFGPGARTAGVIDHIRKELAEIEADPLDIREWVDVIILAFDGAWRAGWKAEDIVAAIVTKQAKNEARTWPDWRTADPNKAIEHDRSAEARTALSQAKPEEG